MASCGLLAQRFPRCCKYVTITRMCSGPEDKISPDQWPSQLRPNSVVYCRKRADKPEDMGHALKNTYRYHNLLGRLNGEALKQ